MARWRDLETDAPELAAFGRPLLFNPGPDDAGLAYLATLRRDGGPRVHPLCIYEIDGSLFVSIEKASPKHRDLKRDPRYMLHAYPGWEGDPEFSIRGRAIEITDAGERGRLAHAKPRLIQPDCPYVFRLDIERADSTFWEGWGTASMHPIRRRWDAGR